MANQYLIDVHQYVSDQMTAANRKRKTAAERGDTGRVRYYDGKLDELNILKDFMTEHFNLTTFRYP